MKYIFTFSFLVYSCLLFSQHLGAYTDYKGYFFIFDHGEHHKVEDLPVQSFRIGGTQVLYIDSKGDLKMYENGTVKELEKSGVNEYYATDHLAAYSIFEKLRVIENGEPVTLSYRCPVYRVEDSLIVFYDKNMESLRIYYDGDTEDIESGMIGIPVQSIRSGDNIVAYISSRVNDFKIYYKGENQTILEHIDRISFKAGKDIVAYINPLDNTFNAFYRGEIFTLEDFPPRSYRMGDGFVAYVDNMGSFKVFSSLGVQELSSYAPDGYTCEDYILSYSDYDYAKVFTRGNMYELENYIPRLMKIDWNTVVYVDNTNRVWMFTGGEKKYLINEMITGLNIYRDLIVIDLKMDQHLIYYQGEFYKGMSY